MTPLVQKDPQQRKGHCFAEKDQQYIESDHVLTLTPPLCREHMRLACASRKQRLVRLRHCGFVFHELKMSVTRSAAANNTKAQMTVRDTFVTVRDSGRRIRTATAAGTAGISISGTSANVTAVKDAPRDMGGNRANN